MNVEGILEDIGGYGRYQMIIYLLICLVCMRGPWHPFVTSFTALTPDLICTNNQNGSKFVVESGDIDLGYCSNTFVNDSSCNYDVSGGKTIVTEWNLICEKKFLVSLNVAVFMMGQIAGAVFLSLCADYVGRKNILIASLVVQSVVGLGAAFVHDYVFFTVLRFLIGALNQGIALTGYVMVSELFPSSCRTKPCVAIQFFWAIGMMLLSGIAYLLKDWTYIQMAISIPNILSIFFIWVLPESVMWLAAKGRFQDSHDILQKFAKWNHKTLPPLLTETGEEFGQNPPLIEETESVRLESLSNADYISSDKLIVSSELLESQRRNNVSDSRICHVFSLFRSPRMALYSIIMFYCWLANSLLYFGISFSATLLPGNIYLNFFLNGLAEVPAYLIGMYVLGIYGRRLPLLTFFLIGGLANILLVFIPSEVNGVGLDSLIITIAMIGKFGITGSYSTTFLYAAEIFPTFIRNSSIGFSSFWETLGGVLAPFVLQWTGGTNVLRVLFGVTALVAAASALCLPETLNQPLPDTVADVESMPHITVQCCHAKEPHNEAGSDPSC